MEIFITYLKVFLTGGIICMIGQILMDKTKLTPARILVLFVTLGVLLTAIGIYEPLKEFGKAGACVPISGFGYTLAKGAIQKVRETGLVGAFTGGTAAAARWNLCSDIFRIYCLINFKTKNKKTITKKGCYIDTFHIN